MKKSIISMLLVTSFCIAPNFALARPEGAHIEVIGNGEVSVKPDMATINIAVALTRKTAKEAKQASDKAIASLLLRLKEIGVAENDIQSANISLRAEYIYPKNQSPKLHGYHANRDVVVRVRELNQLNNILDGALADGLNRINGIRLGSSKELQLKAQARSKAIEDAINKAKQLAQGFNQEIAGVWQIQYLNHMPVPGYRMLKSENAGNNLGYVDANINISDSVNVIFRLQGGEVIYRPLAE